MSNANTVRDIYAAFGRGDAPAIIERLSDDIEWEYAYADYGVPYLVPRRGRAAVAGFFAALASTAEVTRFEVKAVVGDGELVVALCDLGLTVKATGRSIAETDEPHLWWFDARGRVRKFRHAADTHQHVQAFARHG